VPPGNGGDQLMCDNSFGRAGSLRSWMVNPPSRHAAYPRSPAVIMWCSATRRPGGHVGLSPAARFMPGSHQRVAQVYMTALADQLGAGRGSYPLTDGALDHVAIGGNINERLAQTLLEDLDLTERMRDLRKWRASPQTTAVASRPARADHVRQQRQVRFGPARAAMSVADHDGR
jgi:hypothetical protein